MRTDLATMIERVVALRHQVRRPDPGDALFAQIEETLTEGYGHALSGDAWSMRSEQRLHDLISDSDSPARGKEIRAVANEHAALQRDVVALRRELAELRHDRDRLRTDARSHATSA